MISGLVIRRAVVSEAPALTDLAMRSKALWGYDEHFMAQCLAELTVQLAAIEAGEVWAAEEAGAIAGVLEIVPEGRSAELRLMFVDPARARSGVGRALWEHAEARARSHGAERLALTPIRTRWGSIGAWACASWGNRHRAQFPVAYCRAWRNRWSPAHRAILIMPIRRCDLALLRR